jgi:hypothetical protein
MKRLRYMNHTTLTSKQREWLGLLLKDIRYS